MRYDVKKFLFVGVEKDKDLFSPVRKSWASSILFLPQKRWEQKGQRPLQIWLKP